MMRTLPLVSTLAIALAFSGSARADLGPGAAPVAPTSVTLTADLSVEAAAEVDDILLVLDLPLAAIELREAGVEEAEIGEALDAVIEAGASAAAATEVLAAESEEIKARGKHKGMGLYVRSLLGEGLRGQALAVKIRERKAEFSLGDAEKAALKETLKAKREEEKALRKAIHERRQALKAEGKTIKIHAPELHERLEKGRLAAKAKAKSVKAEAKGKADAKREAAAERREDAVERREEKAADRAEKAGERAEKAEERAEKAEERAEKAEERAEKRGEREERRDERAEKRDSKNAGPK